MESHLQLTACTVNTYHLVCVARKHFMRIDFNKQKNVNNFTVPLKIDAFVHDLILEEIRNAAF